MFEHEVLPLLDERRGRIPEHGKLEQDHIVIEQALLLAVYVDLEAWIFGVKIDESDSINFFRFSDHRFIRMRVFVPRMGIVNDQLRHSATGPGLCILDPFYYNTSGCAQLCERPEYSFVLIMPCWSGN